MQSSDLIVISKVRILQNISKKPANAKSVEIKYEVALIFVPMFHAKFTVYLAIYYKNDVDKLWLPSLFVRSIVFTHGGGRDQLRIE